MLSAGEMMWSIKLIIGVAVAGSVTMTLTGITLAVMFERRRYRKYLRRHTAGMATEDQHEVDQHVHECDCKALTPDNPEIAILRKSSETWTTLPSSNDHGHKRRSKAASPTMEEKPAAQKNLHKTIRGPVKKKKGNRKRLKRMPHHRPMAPSLPVIVEHSDGSQPSFELERLSHEMSGRESCESETNNSSQWPLSEPGETHTMSGALFPPVAVFRANAENFITRSRSRSVPNSVSMTSSISSVPEDPLPPLPIIQTQKNMLHLRQRTSITSIDSVSSSVLDSHSPPSRKSAATNEKTHSQVLREFDFGLSSIPRQRSPLHQTVSIREVAITSGDLAREVDATTETTNHSLIDIGTSKVLTNLEPAAHRLRNVVTTTAGRHSMYDNAEALRSWRNSGVSGSSDNRDPFISGAPPRPLSLVERVPLQELDTRLGVQRTNMRQRVSDEASLRDTDPRTDQWPILAPILKGLKQHDLLDPMKVSSVQDHSWVGAETLRKEPILRETRREFSQPRERSSDENLRALDPLRLSRNDLPCSSPNTPQSGIDQKWRFDFLLPDTPSLLRPPTPERSHNSPTLPSPAYTSQQLYLRPRNARIRGPRSPPGSRSQSRSPLRKSTSILSGVKSGSVSRTERHEPTTHLRKSVILLRTLNSEGQLLNSEQSLAYYRLGSIGKESPSIPKKTPDKNSLTMTSMSSVTFPVPSVQVKASLSSLQSSESNSGVSSIWEDASVQEDLPESESQVLTLIQGRTCSTDNSVSVSEDTLKTCAEDLEACENLVQNYDGVGHLKQIEMRQG